MTFEKRACHPLCGYSPAYPVKPRTLI